MLSNLKLLLFLTLKRHPRAPVLKKNATWKKNNKKLTKPNQLQTNKTKKSRPPIFYINEKQLGETV